MDNFASGAVGIIITAVLMLSWFEKPTKQKILYFTCNPYFDAMTLGLGFIFGQTASMMQFGIGAGIACSVMVRIFQGMYDKNELTRWGWMYYTYWDASQNVYLTKFSDKFYSYNKSWCDYVIDCAKKGEEYKYNFEQWRNDNDKEITNLRKRYT